MKPPKKSPAIASLILFEGIVLAVPPAGDQGQHHLNVAASDTDSLKSDEPTSQHHPKGESWRLRFLSLALVVLLASCTKSHDSVINPRASEGDLLSNGSFEVNGVASLQGWRANSSDTAIVSFSTDVPPGGGSFSIRLRNEWTFGGRIVAAIAAPAGTHRYRLSGWVKCLPNPYARGSVSLSLESHDSVLSVKYFSFTDTIWTEGSLGDTLSTTVGDTLFVGLSGDIHQIAGGYSLFDLCKLERLD